MANPNLQVIDPYTKKTFEIPIKDGTIQATEFARIKVNDSGLCVFDSGYQNTAVVRSSISYIDGDRGILEYRGYPIEELAEKASFLEVAYLLIFGDLPTKVACIRNDLELICLLGSINKLDW